MITLQEVHDLQSNPEPHLETLLAPGVVCLKCGGRVCVKLPTPDALLPVNHYYCVHCGPTGVVPRADLIPVMLPVVN